MEALEHTCRFLTCFPYLHRPKTLLILGAYLRKAYLFYWEDVVVCGTKVSYEKVVQEQGE